MQLRLQLIFTLLFVTTLLCAGNVWSEVTVEARLNHASFPVDRMSQLSITVNGASRNTDINLPQIDKISFHSRGQSSQINLSNGAFSSSLTHQYLVQAEEPGDYVIPTITVSVSGKDYQTKPINFTVIATKQTTSSNNGQSAQGLDEVAFLRVTRTGKHYPGEIVPITIKAYFNQKYRFDDFSLPTMQGKGVVSPQLQGDPVQNKESINNNVYHVLTWDTTLSGVKVGKQSVKFTMDAAILIPQQRVRQSPFGNSIFDNFLGGYQRKPISLASEETVFTVLPLPTEDTPVSFTGAIGTFDFKVTASPLSLTVGEPITLTMTISGNGNFDRVESPVFPDITDWKTYTPTSEFLPENSDGLASKRFEQAIVVKNSSIREIPSLSFSYFDPEQKAYVTKTSEPITITLQNIQTATVPVQLRPTAVEAQATPTTESNDIFQGLAPIHLETGDFQDVIEPLYKKSWYLLACTLAIILALTAIFLKNRKLKKSRHPEIDLKRNQKQQLKNDMMKLAQIVDTGDCHEFLEQSRRTIQTQLGFLWTLEPAAISYADLSNRLPTNSPLLEIFTRAEAAAYGAVLVSDEQMQTYMTAMSTELENLI